VYEIGRATQVGRLNTDVSFNAELCTFLDTQRVKYLYSFRSDTGSISTRNPTTQRMTGYAYIQSGSGLFLFFVALTGNGKLWALPGFVVMMGLSASHSKGKLLYCFLGIFVSYFIYGILQENM